MNKLSIEGSTPAVEAALHALLSTLALPVRTEETKTHLIVNEASFQKPVRWAEIKRHLTQQQQTSSEIFPVGPYICNAIARTLTKDSATERLTEKEADLLRLLASGHPVQREELLEKVWGYRADLETHTLETHIYRLRQKIEADATAPQYLITVEGGYQLCRA
jgi:DNA-binding response OmpR family regulator